MARLAEKVPALRWIDIDLGQLQFENPPIDYPAALIDIQGVDYSNAGGNTQIAQTTVAINLAFKVHGPSNHLAPESQRVAAMKHYDVVTDVYEALQGYATEEFSPLTRLSLQRQASTWPRHYTMVFRTQGVDRSAVKQRVPWSGPVVVK